MSIGQSCHTQQTGNLIMSSDVFHFDLFFELCQLQKFLSLVFAVDHRCFTIFCLQVTIDVILFNMSLLDDTYRKYQTKRDPYHVYLSSCGNYGRFFFHRWVLITSICLLYVWSVSSLCVCVCVCVRVRVRVRVCLPCILFQIISSIFEANIIVQNQKFWSCCTPVYH